MTTSSGAIGGQPGATFPKRFYKAATIAPVVDGFALQLDGMPARTPSRSPVVLPSADLAQIVADEWNAVETTIDPRSMPFTRLVNSVIDGVSRAPAAVREEILRYAGSDLLAYRAAEPSELVAAQRAAWDPILAWAQDSFGAAPTTAAGIVFVEQSPYLARGIAKALDATIGQSALAPFRLAALHVITTLTGSTLLALAVAEGRLRDHEAWAAAHVDEDFQIARWGADAEAELRRGNRWREMETAARVLTLPGS